MADKQATENGDPIPGAAPKGPRPPGAPVVQKAYDLLLWLVPTLVS